MKKMLMLIGLLFFSCVSIAHSAEYIVQQGDAIGTVAEDTGCTIEQLALLNDITAPDYIIRADAVLQYVDTSDIRDARKWIEDRLAMISMSEVEHAAFEKMLQDINARKISYGSVHSTDASEILLLAQAYREKRDS